MAFTVTDLNPSTWARFAELVERNNGIFGGCWCIGWHPECGQQNISHRQVKEDRVRTGRAHAALVIDECGAAQGWCQYGSAEELSNIKHKRKYDQAAPPVPDWRIACFYVDPKHRAQGIARAALGGALDQIADAGGGVVEAIPGVTGSAKRTAASSSAQPWSCSKTMASRGGARSASTLGSSTSWSRLRRDPQCRRQRARSPPNEPSRTRGLGRTPAGGRVGLRDFRPVGR